MTVGNRLASWDESEIAEDRIQYLIDEEGHSQEEAERLAREDQDLYSWEWESLEECLTEILKDRSLLGLVHIEVNNFGWRSLDGQQFADIENGKALLNAMLPNTQCTFHIHEYQDGEVKGLAVQNFHHDSCTGNEWYYILPAKSCEVCGDYLPIDQGGIECPACGELICYDCFGRYVDDDHLCGNCEAEYPPEVISLVYQQIPANAI